MTGPVTRHRGIESLKTAARWPGADRATTVILAIRLAAARADAEGYRYFCELAGARPGEALPLALAGFSQARLGEDADAALAKPDQAAAADLGPPQYFRGLALAGLPPDRQRAARAVADLESVLAVRDQFPPMLIRAAYHGLATAHAALGHDAQAAEAMRKSGLGAAPAGHAAALDLLAGGRDEPFAAAAATLIGQGDHALALDIIQPGLLRHPASTALARLRRTALHRLMEACQQTDPFKFLIYAELAGADIGPVG
jgi:hypothetical protein